MKNALLFMVSAILFLSSCKKSDVTLPDPVLKSNTTGKTLISENDFTQFTIKQGEHYCDRSTLVNVEYDTLRFSVKFDSSAVYETKDISNQADINKLYGFSDNNEQHHQFSARFGWCWNGNSVSLFAYTYNKGERSSKFLDSLQIGTTYQCAIGVSKDHYTFSVENKIITMPRLSKTPKGSGYKLFPYFGGDESAPHDIKIWIKEY